MGLFSRKRKTPKEDQKKEEEKATTPCEHRAQHAAAHSAGQGSSTDSSDQARPHTMAHGTPLETPSPNLHRPTLSRPYSEDGQSRSSDWTIMTPAFKIKSSITAPKLHRSSTDYFANSNAYYKQPAPNGHYADSGYESAEPASALHSRAPSEHNLYDSAKAYLTQNNTLPELVMSGENSLEAEIAANSKNIGSVSPLDLNSDARSIKSYRSVSKRTRFEDAADPMPALAQIEQHRKDSGESSESQREQASAEQCVQLQRTQSLRSFRGGSLPPLSILEGFKVNKKGRILDEEGEPIGELVDGDLLDCVRQKANANGEVIDEFGRVVGHVRTYAPHTVSAIVAPTQQTASVTTGANTRKSETVPVATLLEDTSRPEPVVEPAMQQTPQSNGVPQLALPPQDPKRISRSASERSLSELSKPYARPTMSSVPENNVPEDATIISSPTLYAYKGEIPVNDGVPLSRRRSRSPPFPGNPKVLPGPGQYAKSALIGGHSTSSLSFPTRPVSMNSRRSTTHFAGGPVPVIRQPLPSAMKKPIANAYVFDITPNGSESGSDPSEDGRMLMLGGHSRSTSMHNVGTMARPRTYFTHAGRVTVDQQGISTTETTPRAQATAAPTKEPAPAPAPLERKKSRMSMSFGKKSKAAA